MLNGSFTRWFLLWFLAVVLLLCVGLGIRVAAAAGNAATGPTCAVMSESPLLINRG